MDKRKSFEVGGHWPLWRGWENRMTTQNRQKSNAKKILISTHPPLEYIPEQFTLQLYISRSWPNLLQVSYLSKNVKIKTKQDLI